MPLFVTIADIHTGETVGKSLFNIWLRKNIYNSTKEEEMINKLYKFNKSIFEWWYHDSQGVQSRQRQTGVAVVQGRR